MTTFRLTFGDECADGHGQYEDVHIEVPGYSGDDLRANFKINEEELNFDASRLASDYQESQVHYDELVPLFEDGFTFGDKTEVEVEEDEVIYLGIDSFTDILMYLYGRGLANFSWRIIEKPEQLNSGNKLYGYGLFGF